MKRWEALINLYELDTKDFKQKCLVCGHKVKLENWMQRHLLEKHRSIVHEKMDTEHGQEA